MEIERRIATLIGDIIDSRKQSSRARLQRRMATVLEEVNETLRPVQPLEPTVGDEFQGGFERVADAALASLLIRLHLLVGDARADSRFGLGWGEITVFERDRTPLSQDGPGWWAARAAIDRAKQLASKPRTSFARTCFEDSPDDGSSDAAASALNAFLICRDASIGEMSTRNHRLLAGLLTGCTQEELAAREGITQGAVSQSLRRSGALAIEAAHARLSQEEE